MKRIMMWMLVLLTALTPCLAQAESVVSYTADFYVADYANVLSDEVEGLIVLNNDQLDKGCGAQIVVVTVDTVGGTTIENYAYALFNEWGIGDEAKNNGLLILLAVQDGSYWLMPGKGLQDYVTAGDLDELAQEYLIPSASVGDYEEGIRQLFAACFEKVSIAYDADVELDDTLYYTWLQSGASGTDGAKYLSQPVREMAQEEQPVEPTFEEKDDPVELVGQPAPSNQGGGFSFMGLIVILVILIVLVGSFGVLRGRPGRHRAAPPPPPRRPAAPPPPPMGGHRPVAPPPPMGGYRPTPRPPMGGRRPAPRPPMSGSRPGGFGGSSSSRPMGGSRPGGGMTRGGGAGGSFGRPSSSRPMGGGSRPGGGFGGGRSGGGGSTRGGGTGGSFRGGR